MLSVCFLPSRRSLLTCVPLARCPCSATLLRIFLPPLPSPPLSLQARLGLTCCFADVHRPQEGLEGNPDTIVAQQVTWLFSAADHAADAEIGEGDFKGCYQKLLAAAYEEEVLALDLKRAIESLTSSADWTNMRQLFATARQIFQSLSGGGDSLSTADAKAKEVLEALFLCITGKSNVMGPKKQIAARKLVASALGGGNGAAAAEGSSAAAAAPASNAVSVSTAQLIKLYKDLLAMHIPVDVLKKSAEESVTEEEGGSRGDDGRDWGEQLEFEHVFTFLFSFIFFFLSFPFPSFSRALALATGATPASSSSSSSASPAAAASN